MGDRNGEDWSHWTKKEKERGVTEIWWKKEKYYFNEKERGWYKMLCGDCCVHDLIFFWLVNQVFKNRFSSRRHVEKMPYQAWLEHWNWVSKTRFISPKSSLLDSRC